MTDVYSKLFDYAGIFPPAELDLATAESQYREFRIGSNGWMVGPFLIKASLVDLSGLRDQPIGLVVDRPLQGQPREFVQAEKATSEALFRDDLQQLLAYSSCVYLESTGEVSALLGAIEAARDEGLDVRAKIRTGSPADGAIPSPEELAEFIQRCVSRWIPFKCTAGLHHPFRGNRDPSRIEHGFVNVLAAVRIALAGLGQDLVACLSDADPASFDVTGAIWSGRGADIPAENVREAFRSFGTCSLHEPAGYLNELGVARADV